MSTLDVHEELGSLLALVDRHVHGFKDMDGAAREESRNKMEWTKCTFAEALQMARHGWPEGTKKAKRLLDKLEVPVLQANHDTTVHDVTGAYVDVGTYVTGAPECMVDFQPDTRPVRFAHIVVGGNYNWRVDTEAVMMRGVAIAAAIDALESRGVRCSVDVVTCTTARYLDYKSGALTTRLPVKEAHEPLNLDKLVFTVAHSGYCRRLIHAVYEQQSDEVRARFGINPVGVYGFPAPIKPVPGAYLFQTIVESDDWSEKAALQKVQAVLQEVVQ